MSKRAFVKLVPSARTVEDALRVAGMELRNPVEFQFGQAEVGQMEAAILRKMQRCTENGGLYADKHAELAAVHKAWKQSPKEAPDLATSLLGHGDSRIDSLARVGVIRFKTGWVVFGFEVG